MRHWKKCSALKGIWGAVPRRLLLGRAMLIYYPFGRAGRIEVDNHPDLTWVGTGWLLADDVVVTNRHVASEFAALSVTSAGRSFVFKRGWPDRGARMSARRQAEPGYLRPRRAAGG